MDKLLKRNAECQPQEIIQNYTIDTRRVEFRNRYCKQIRPEAHGQFLFLYTAIHFYHKTVIATVSISNVDRINSQI